MKQHSERFVRLVEQAGEQVDEVTLDEALGHVEAGTARLIDVREESEWQAGHIPGAVHIGKGVIERDIENEFPNTDEPLILYCGGGYRSLLAADNLKKMGYVNVRSMAGGYRAYRDQKEKDQ